MENLHLFSNTKSYNTIQWCAKQTAAIRELCLQQDVAMEAFWGRQDGVLALPPGKNM